jgi:hypothetical protein
MNRKFNHINKKDRDFNAVTTIKNLIKNQEVDLVLNLHDGHGYYRHRWQNRMFNPKAWGQSFIIDQEKIDGNIKFNGLKKIAKQVSKKLNKNLHKNHHKFYVKNTHTKLDDKQMQLSLTFFAIKNQKPAFAIETSKNITDLTRKVQYQLKAIEEFMKIMGIKFSRDFDINNYKQLKKIVYGYESVKINDNIYLELNDIKKSIRYIPLKQSGNKFEFTHPLGGVVKIKNRAYNLYVGNLKITTLRPQTFAIQKSDKPINMIIDGVSRDIALGTQVDIKKSFIVDSTYRTNIIGFTKRGVKNESGFEISKKMLSKKYSIDKKHTKYRVEFYNNKNSFLGMIIVRFIKKPKTK